MNPFNFLLTMAGRRACSILGAAGTVLLAIVMSSPAVAQVDTDFTNNTMAGADVFSLAPGTAVSNLANFAGAGNDVDFYSVQLVTGDILLGMTTPLGNLPGNFDSPDTMAGVFGSGVPLTFSDDDGADELPDSGHGRGSLFRLKAQASGMHHIGVTGYGDYEFDGAASGDGHTEAGRYALTVGRVNPAVLGGGFADTDPTNRGILPIAPAPYNGTPDLISFGPSGASVAVSELLSGDIDFYEVHLSAGQVLSAMTAPLGDLSNSFEKPDTRLVLFSGELLPQPRTAPFFPKLVENEDAGNFEESPLNPELGSDNPYVAFGIFGSALRARVLTTGTYYLGVTGFGDVTYTGAHGDLGRYALLVGVAVPEPGSLMLAAMSVVGALALGRRKRRFGAA